MIFSESLKKYGDFQRVYKKGRSYANRYLIMYILKQDTHRNRIGISVSKKVGNSVVRHRITRLIRESYRLNEKEFVDGFDIVVIARPGAKERNFFEIESALLHLGRLHGIVEKAEEKEVKKEDEKNIDLSD
jgi:ribonuclease P protein component